MRPKLTCTCGGNIMPVGIPHDELSGYDGDEWQCVTCEAFYKPVPHLYCEQSGKSKGGNIAASEGAAAKLEWVD